MDQWGCWATSNVSKWTTWLPPHFGDLDEGKLCRPTRGKAQDHYSHSGEKRTNTQTHTKQEEKTKTTMERRASEERKEDDNPDPNTKNQELIERHRRTVVSQTNTEASCPTIGGRIKHTYCMSLLLPDSDKSVQCSPAAKHISGEIRSYLVRQGFYVSF